MHQSTNFLPASLVVLLPLSTPSYSQNAKLIEAAKKEGKVVAYGSLESDNADAVFQVFKKKTGIDVDYWRASATKVMDRALSEYRAGKPLFDLIITNDLPMKIMWKEGIFTKNDSPSSKDFTKDQCKFRAALSQCHNRGCDDLSVISPAEAPSLSKTS